MMNRFRVSSALSRRPQEVGLSPLGVLRQAGLPMGRFNQERILLTTEEFFALYRGIAEVSRDPAIGLKLGTEDRIERYDPIAIRVLEREAANWERLAGAISQVVRLNEV